MIRYAKKLSRVLLSPLMALNRSLVVSGLICYMQELAFHRRAKNLLLASQGNKALLIRKYTHFLERFLFQPSAYEDGFGERVAAQLETFLENAGEGLQSDQQKWAKKILEEFYAGADHEVRCPLLIKGTKRSNPSMDIDNLMKLIRSRRSRRIFTDMPLTEEERDKITEAAQWTPSTCNRQSLHLIFIEDPDLKSFVASTVPGGHQFFLNAPCIIIMVADVSDYRFPSDRVNPFMEAGAAVQNIYLVCETMGLGCCWGSYTSFGSVLMENEVRNRLGIPPTYLIVASLAVGKSEQIVCKIPRDRPKTRYGVNRFRGESA